MRRSPTTTGRAAESGRQTVREGFPDRGYTAGRPGEGRLVPRDQPDALVADPDDVAANAVILAGQVDSVCVHGDSPGAVVTARRVRRSLEAAGFVVRPWV